MDPSLARPNKDPSRAAFNTQLTVATEPSLTTLPLDIQLKIVDNLDRWSLRQIRLVLRLGLYPLRCYLKAVDITLNTRELSGQSERTRFLLEDVPPTWMEEMQLLHADYPYAYRQIDGMCCRTNGPRKDRIYSSDNEGHNYRLHPEVVEALKRTLGEGGAYRWLCFHELPLSIGRQVISLLKNIPSLPNLRVRKVYLVLDDRDKQGTLLAEWLQIFIDLLPDGKLPKIITAGWGWTPAESPAKEIELLRQAGVHCTPF